MRERNVVKPGRESCLWRIVLCDDWRSIPSHKWSPKAAALLYRYLHKLKTCSRAMAWITKFPAFPITSTSGKMLALKAGYYIHQVWQEYKKIEKNEKQNPRCSQTATGIGNYPNQIYLATLGLWNYYYFYFYFRAYALQRILNISIINSASLKIIVYMMVSQRLQALLWFMS